MKKIKRILLCFAILISQFTLLSQTYDDFYYAFDDKVYLNAVNNKYVVEFPNGVDENLFNLNNLTYEKLNDKVYTITNSLTSIQNIFGQSFYFNPVYQTLNGNEIYITREIILKYKTGVSESDKNNLITLYNLQSTKTTRLYSTFIVNNSLQISKAIYLTGLVDYCYPNFFCQVQFFDGYIPNDEYFSKQFYLNNTGQPLNDGHCGKPDADINAPEAWNITKGNSSIIIAVIDEGVTNNHYDLPSNRQIRLPGSNFVSSQNPDDPSPDADGNHGNACAGIIAATQDNNQGVSGIAPLCKIMPIKIPSSKDITNIYADAITFAYENGADIISNSWGWAEPPYFASAVVAAIQDAIDGGCLVIFSAGNTANHLINEPGFVTFPANANVNELITVGASDRNDLQANYSPTSIYLDIAAPSQTAFNSQIQGEGPNVWTIDIPAYSGFNPWHLPDLGIPALGEVLPNYGTNNLFYTGRMGGTSAAAPQVAGCAALALSVNQNLSVNQINNLVKYKADKVGDYNYYWNPLMPGRSTKLGYGRLNCYKMVETAQKMYTTEIDLYTRDTPGDFGIEPNEAGPNAIMYLSEDIWVRNQNDGLTNQVHENPVYSATNPVYVYVRVTNKGEITSYGNEQLYLHWAKASAALPWPENWNGSMTDPLMGDLLDIKTIPALPAGSETILTYTWNDVPNPDDYESINPDDKWHFCLLARIVASSDPMTFPEGPSVNENTFQNNNIAWKNITIVDNKSEVRNPGGVIGLGNIFREQTTFEMEFKVPQPCVGHTILDEAEVKLTLDDMTYSIWAAGGKQGSNIKELKNKQVLITGDPAFLRNLTYEPFVWSTLFVGFNFITGNANSNKTEFQYLATEKRTSDQMVIGGELFIIKKPVRNLFDADAGEDKEISKDESTTIQAQAIGEAAEYNWYDLQDSLIYSGTDLNITLDTTSKFKLEVLALTDGFKDYDEVTVNVKEYEITNITPNPANDEVTVEYEIEGVTFAYLLITKPYSTETETYILDIQQNQIILNVSNLPSGVYGCILVCNDQFVDQKLLLIY